MQAPKPSPQNPPIELVEKLTSSRWSDSSKYFPQLASLQESDLWGIGHSGSEWLCQHPSAPNRSACELIFGSALEWKEGLWEFDQVDQPNESKRIDYTSIHLSSSSICSITSQCRSISEGWSIHSPDMTSLWKCASNMIARVRPDRTFIGNFSWKPMGPEAQHASLESR